MKLKQFLVHCPYIRNDDRLKKIMEEQGIDYSEAIKIDYQNNHKENVVKMRDDTRCITSMIERYYTPITTDKYWEIIINVLKPEDKDFRENSSGSALETYCIYDYNHLFELDDFNIKKVTLDLVESTVLSAMKEHNWDIESFKNACNLVRKNNYQNNWVWKKKKNNGFIAEIRVEHNVKTARVFLDVTNANGEIIKEQLLAETIPIESVYFPYFGELMWTTDNCITLNSHNGNIYKIEI